MINLVRNHLNVPNLETEGVLLKPIDKPRHKNWKSGLTPYERLHCHHTLASVRRYAYFKPFPGLIPEHSLDLALSANYDHGTEEFPDIVDPLLQPETLGLTSWRRLRNTKDVLPGEDPRIAKLMAEFEAKEAKEALEWRRPNTTTKGTKKVEKASMKYVDNHPLLIGGITERRHPSNVKLMNSSHHSPQTNAGYTRQNTDGNVFVY